ncbi:MAG: cytochrome d ubiquinol oxidase subunit II [Actinomycetales bacterium]
MLADVVAAAMFAGVVVYAVFGGADFGSGFWDLTAGDAERGGRLRLLVDHSIGPVWEANHVWLVYVLVFWWTAFPRAFAAATTTLFVPLALALVGIVLRGASFAFRKYAATLHQARLFGAVFAGSSLITPFFLGAAAGAVASGRVPRNGYGDVWSSWTTPTSVLGGLLAVATCSFLAGVFLTAEAQRARDVGLAEQLRRGSIVVGVVTGAITLAAIVPIHRDAPTLGHELTRRALPLVVISAAAGLSTLLLLWRRRYAVARLGAVAAVASVVAGWGVAQYPWVLTDQMRISAAAGSHATLTGLLVVLAVASIVVVPALGYLFWLTQTEGWSDHVSSAP